MPAMSCGLTNVYIALFRAKLRSFTGEEQRCGDKGWPAHQQPSLCHSVSPGGSLSASVTEQGARKLPQGMSDIWHVHQHELGITATSLTVLVGDINPMSAAGRVVRIRQVSQNFAPGHIPYDACQQSTEHRRVMCRCPVDCWPSCLRLAREITITHLGSSRRLGGTIADVPKLAPSPVGVRVVVRPQACLAL